MRHRPRNDRSTRSGTLSAAAVGSVRRIELRIAGLERPEWEYRDIDRHWGRLIVMHESEYHSSVTRHISFRELQSHSTYDNAWISINGIVYDITKFIPNHPFGDTFRGHLGTECGGLFNSAHLNTRVDKLISSSEYLSKNTIVIVGKLDVSTDHPTNEYEYKFLDRIIYQDVGNDAFWTDLRAAVVAFLKTDGNGTHYSFSEGLVHLGYHLSVYVLLSYFAWARGSYIGAALLGFIMVCTLANISHMATHHGFVQNKALNLIAMLLYDLSGTSGLEWQIAHQTHHTQPHSSIDYQTNAYEYLGVRIHKYMVHRAHHKFQPLYYWLVISVYLPFKFFATTYWIYKNRRYVRNAQELGGHLVARVISITWIACCIYYHGATVALVVFSTYAIVYSQTAFILLFNNHEQTHCLLGEHKDVRAFHGKLSWAEVQVRTSGNWYPTNPLLAFIEFHYGYFNYHIEHHLFPTLKPSLLKKIAPIVREVCRKHDVPYILTTFLELQQSLKQHLLKLS